LDFSYEFEYTDVWDGDGLKLEEGEWKELTDAGVSLRLALSGNGFRSSRCP
jgi:hypothetical protein